ncbi:MAG: hypothetical protein WCD26_07380 [Pseudolabrys sp.]
MTSGELNRLEREVEEARHRLTADLDRLRAPDTFSSFKDDLVSEARNAKDEWTQRLIEEVKNRAAANPIATAAIGAGLLWHLVRHPPITSLLVGAGVFSLIRTDPDQPSVAAGMISQAGDMALTVTEKVAELRSDATEVTAEFAGSAKEKVSKWTAQSRDAARDEISNVASTAEDLTGRVSQVVGEVINDDRARDGLLLGAATLAIAAAVGLAYQRRASGDTYV